MIKEILILIGILVFILIFVDNARWYLLKTTYIKNQSFCVFDKDCNPSCDCINYVASIEECGENITRATNNTCTCISFECKKIT
jgi:hypothetical protein